MGQEPFLGGDRRLDRVADPGIRERLRQAQQLAVSGRREEASAILKEMPDVPQAAELLAVLDQVEQAQQSELADAVLGLVMLGVPLIAMGAATAVLWSRGLPLWPDLLLGAGVGLLGGIVVDVGIIGISAVQEMVREGSEPRGCLFIGIPIGVLLMVAGVGGVVFFLLRRVTP